MNVLVNVKSLLQFRVRFWQAILHFSRELVKCGLRFVDAEEVNRSLFLDRHFYHLKEYLVNPGLQNTISYIKYFE